MKLYTFLRTSCVTFFVLYAFFIQAQLIHQTQSINHSNLSITTATILGQVTINPTVAGKVIVRFDGTCISDDGDRIVLAASDTPNWSTNTGSISVEATNSDINRNSFSHSRVYSVGAGSYTYYAIGHNTIETAGNGLASIYGNLIVEFYPTSTTTLIENVDVHHNNLDVSTSTIVGQATINPTETGKVIVRFDGNCTSDVGDRIVLAASNTTSWGSNAGNVSVEAFSSDIDTSPFTHSRIYTVSPGTHTFYAVAHNFVETAGNGIITLNGNLSVEFFPSSLATIQHSNISQTNIDVTNVTTLAQQTINPTEAGKVIVRFNGSCTASPGDKIVLAASDTPNWGVNEAQTSIEPTDNDINRKTFSHTRKYDVTPGTHTYYAVAQNIDETAGSGIASFYSTFSVEYFNNTAGVSTGVIEDWLAMHPNIAQEITWNFDKNIYDIRSYPSWDTADKAHLQSLYDNLLQGNYPTFPDPVNNILANTTSYPYTIMGQSDAENIYFAFLATSLYHEINNIVSWSITTFNQKALQTLYNWNEYFTVNSNIYTNNQLEFVIWIRSTPAPPSYLKTNFIDTYNIIDATQKKTYGNILSYARDSMLHFGGSYTALNAHDHWQYYGHPPMSKVIDGTTRTYNSLNQFGHWTAGCHGTVTFTQWLGFYLNIPVIDNVRAGHRIAILPSADSLFITHGDDPYNQGAKNPKINGRHMLVNKEHYEYYFGASNSSTWINHVGKRINEIAFNTLPHAYLNAYCNDYNNTGNLGTTNYLANNYAGLNNKFPPELMDSLHLWDRIHLKLKENNNSCFSGYNQTIPYEAHSINWDALQNAQINSDTSITKQNLNLPMYGRSNTCISDGEWVEMVLYNTKDLTWLGLANASNSNLNDMDFAIRIEANTFDIYENGLYITTISDNYNLSVNWFQISLENGAVKYRLNGFVHHQHPHTNTGEQYKIHFGAEALESEINNIYTSSSTNDCCPIIYEVTNTPILDDVYPATHTLLGSGIIPTTGNVTFKAGTQICLENGFEVELGAEFEATIQNCSF